IEMFAELTAAAISEQVRRFYDKARQDDLLGPVFAAAIADWEPHLRDISDFWSGALLGVRRYKGDPLGAHRKHPLSTEMFDRWLTLWAETADETFVPELSDVLKARAGMIGRSLQAGLFFRPD
ncbi:MAG TPA: group III truncated hemoglobin, partial [Phenylobacterium sp.]|nr:group III truncated hemoglobin [Phenylobacterium sp.]